jgi:hypothetical protein
VGRRVVENRHGTCFAFVQARVIGFFVNDSKLQIVYHHCRTYTLSSP